MGMEMVDQREAREECDRRTVVIKEMLESLLSQVKGKGKQSDPTPERSVAAEGRCSGGNRPPLNSREHREPQEEEIVIIIEKNGEKEDGMRDLQDGVESQEEMRVRGGA